MSTGQFFPLREHEAYLVRQVDRATWTPDAAVAIRFQHRSAITDHPVEGGVTASDHAQRLPDTVVVTCVVSENPTGAGALAGPARLRDRIDWLRETQDAGQMVDIVTRRFGTLPGYLLTAIPYVADNVARVRFDLELRELRQITATEVVISVADVTEDVATGAPDEVDVGEQGATDTSEDAEAEAVDESLLYWLLYGDDAPEEA